jgi:hypothetical protein
MAEVFIVPFSPPIHWAHVCIDRVFAEIEDWVMQNKKVKTLLPTYNFAIIRFYDFFINNKNMDRVTFQECLAMFIAVYIDYIDVPDGFVYCWLQHYKAYKMSLMEDGFISCKFYGFVKFNQTVQDCLLQKIWRFHVDYYRIGEHFELFDETLYKSIVKQIGRMKNAVVSRIPNCYYWFYYMDRIYHANTGIMNLPTNRRIWEHFGKTVYYEKLKKYMEVAKKKSKSKGEIVDDKEFLEKCKHVAEIQLWNVNNDGDDAMDCSGTGWMFL